MVEPNVLSSGADKVCNVVNPSTSKLVSIIVEPVICTSPINREPLSIDSTTNPSSGVTDAVTDPDAILNASPVNADRGISNRCLPEPLKLPLISLATNLSAVSVFSTVTLSLISTLPSNTIFALVGSSLNTLI